MSLGEVFFCFFFCFCSLVLSNMRLISTQRQEKAKTALSWQGTPDNAGVADDGSAALATPIVRKGVGAPSMSFENANSPITYIPPSLRRCP